MTAFADLRGVRRVITGYDGAGHSNIAFDEVAQAYREHHLYPGVAATDLWRSAAGLDPADHADGVAEYARLPPGGSQFYVVTIAPRTVVPIHASQTVDHHCVVSGEIVCVLEDGEVAVGAGDVLVVRGGAHGWENRTDAPWVSVVTMVSAAPAPEAPRPSA